MKKISVAIFILFVFGLILFTQNKDDLIIYQTDVHSDDIHILDFTLVNSNNQLYIPKNFKFKNLFENDANKFGVTLAYEGDNLYDWHIDMEYVPESWMGDVLLNDISLDQDKSITFIITYKKDGEDVQLEEAVNLKQIIRSE